MKLPPWFDLQQQIMRAVGENPAAFKRKPEDEQEHQRQQANAEARAERWARLKDDEAFQALPKWPSEEKCNQSDFSLDG